MKQTSYVDLREIAEVRSYLKVALVGGQATGKSFISDDIQVTLAEQVCCVHETARMLREGTGFDPDERTDPALVLRFQSSVFHVQDFCEGVACTRAKLSRYPMVLCDRTVFDGVPYLQIKDYVAAVEAFEDLCGIPNHLWSSFYDVILFLEMPSQEIFEVRRPGKSYDLAVWRSDVLEQIWVNHPNFIRVRDDEPGGKLAFVKALVAKLLQGEEEERPCSIA